MRAPWSKTRANTNKRSTASHGVMERFQSMWIGRAGVETLFAIPTTTKRLSSSASTDRLDDPKQSCKNRVRDWRCDNANHHDEAHAQKRARTVVSTECACDKF